MNGPNPLIPRSIHFIYGLNGDPFRLTDRVAIRSAHVHNPNWRIYVWCPAEPAGEQWEKLKAVTPLTLIFIDDPRTWNGHAVPQHQHRADLLRHTILYTMGGAYLDTDTITLAPFPDEWLTHDCVIGREYHGLGGRDRTIGLCNAVMLARMHSRFQWLWLVEWQHFNGEGWNEYSVQLPWRLHLQYPGLCHVLDWQLLGPIHCDLYLYWDRREPLRDCVVAHLWRTYSGPRMEALTEDTVRAEPNTYCLHANEYL